MKYAYCVSTFVALVVVGCAPTSHINFNDLSLISAQLPGGPVQPAQTNTHYPVGTKFIPKDKSAEVQLVVTPFQWPDKTTWTTKGFVEVVPTQKAGGSGNEVHFSNACLGVIAKNEKTATKISALYGDYGGNVNLIENGILHNCPDITKILQPPPVSSLKATVGKLPQGTIKLNGTLAAFSYNNFPPSPLTDKCFVIVVGGQEVWIDDIAIQFEP